MTRFETSTHMKLMLGILAILAVLLVPSNALAQGCTPSPGVYCVPVLTGLSPLGSLDGSEFGAQLTFTLVESNQPPSGPLVVDFTFSSNLVTLCQNIGATWYAQLPYEGTANPIFSGDVGSAYPAICTPYTPTPMSVAITATCQGKTAMATLMIPATVGTLHVWTNENFNQETSSVVAGDPLGVFATLNTNWDPGITLSWLIQVDRPDVLKCWYPFAVGTEPCVNMYPDSDVVEFIANPVSEPTNVTITVTLADYYNEGIPIIGNISATKTITVLPGSGENGSNLGKCDCITEAGSPINLTNGNVHVQHTDYSIPGLNGGLKVLRTWNSRWQDAGSWGQSGMFGRNWVSNFEVGLSFPSSSTAKLWRDDGQAWSFQWSDLTESYTLTSPPDVRATLTYDSIAGKYNALFADGSREFYDPNGFLLSKQDRNGNATKLSWDSSFHLLSDTDPAGRALTFTYGDSNNPGQVTSISDATGIVATYIYDTNQNLTAVIYPDGSRLNFVYDQNTFMLLSVLDTESKVLETHTYDAFHRGLTSSRALGADSLTVNYNASGQAQMSDSMGNATTYGSQTISGKNFVNAITGPGCSSCGGRNNQSLTYDFQGNVSTTSDALNNTSFTYDSNGNVLTKSVPLNPATTLTWTYTYN